MASSRHENQDLDEPQLRQLIDEARAGSDEAMGALVERCRPYLLLIANQEVGQALKSKVGASDVVQETLVQARDDIGQFDGDNEQQLLAWLRQILLHEIADTRRHHGAQKRALHREKPLVSDSVISREATRFVSEQMTPSSAATAREQAAELRQAVERLPPDYIQVIDLRNWQHLAWDEVGRQMNRSPEAVRKLWARAVDRLRAELDGEPPAVAE